MGPHYIGRTHSSQCIFEVAHVGVLPVGRCCNPLGLDGLTVVVFVKCTDTRKDTMCVFECGKYLPRLSPLLLK